MYLCYQEPAPGYISKLISARRALSPQLLHHLQLLLSSLHFTTACCPGPGFAEEELFFLEVSCPVDRCCSCTALLVSTKKTAAICFPGGPMPIRPLLFLYRLGCVHQEDRSSSLARPKPLLKNVLTNAPSVSSQHFDCHRHLPRNILVALVTLLRMCYPSAHPRMCYPSAHPRTCDPSAHRRTCYPSARYTRAPILCPTRNRAAILCTTPTHARALLVHCYVLSCTCLVYHSCTTP